MSANNTATSSTGRLAPAIIAAILALAVYVYLFDRWQSAKDAPAAVEQRDVGNPSAQLTLSRELSAPSERGALIVASPRNRSLAPLLAFVLPLCAGLLLGRALSRRTAAASEPRPAPAAPAAHDTPQRESAAPASTKPALRDPRQNLPVARQTADDGLHEALRAKDELIASLESIVNDNREQWHRRDQLHGEDAGRIAQLEAELAAAGRVIAHMEADFNTLRGQSASRAKPQFVARG